jgi:hypothetical protein
MRIFKIHSIVTLLVTSGLTILPCVNMVYAQGEIGAGAYAFPNKGQSKQQIQKDNLYCHNWAVTETGYDPTRPPPPPPSYATAPPPDSSGYFGSGDVGQGGVVRDAAGGAALGAIGGAIAGNAGTGAAIGALAGGLFGGAKRSSRQSEEQRWQQQQYQQQMQQQQAYQQQISQASSGYRRAYSACMSSLDYTVQ